MSGYKLIGGSFPVDKKKSETLHHVMLCVHQFDITLSKS